MTGYTKLFSSILDSTIWDEDCATRILWITMLAMVNMRGQVLSSEVNMGLRARLPLDDVKKGLACLLADDPNSRTPEFNGRRIEKIDGGWQVLNYEKYRTKQDRTDYMRKYMRKYRAVNKNGEAGKQELAAGKQVLAKAEAKYLHNTTPYNPPSSVNFVNQLIEEQNFKNKIQNPQPKIQPPRNCLMPECGKPVDPKYKPFCSQACKDYADFLNSKYGPSA